MDEIIENINPLTRELPGDSFEISSFCDKHTLNEWLGVEERERKSPKTVECIGRMYVQTKKRVISNG